MNKKPILRHIQAAFRAGAYLDLYAVDLGGESHGFTGELIADGNVLQQVTGRIQGLKFTADPMNKGGRPRALGKHAAIAMAVRLFESRGNTLSKSREMAATIFFLADERSVRRIANEKGCPLIGHTLLIHDEANGIGHCFAMEDKESISLTAEKITVNGRGWFWKEGEKMAKRGVITVEGEGTFNPEGILAKE